MGEEGLSGGWGLIDMDRKDRMERQEEVFGILKSWKERRKAKESERLWVRYFPNEKERERWRGLVDDPEVAREWAESGISPSEARRWMVAGFTDPQIALDWWDFGFTPREAKKWMEVGVTNPLDASDWEAFGIDPEEAREWVEAGVGPEDARAWRQRGFSVKEAIRWMRRGFFPDEAAELKSRKVRGKKGEQ